MTAPKSLKERPEKRKVLTIALVAAAVLLVIALILYEHFYRGGGIGYAHGAGEAAVHFVDVGQGDCIVIQLPDGKNVLIDGGDTSSAVKNKVTGYIAALGITRFDVVLLTHGDADHAGGLRAVLAMPNLRAETIYMPYLRSTSDKDPLKDTAAVLLTTAVYRGFVEAVVGSGAAIRYTLAGGLPEAAGAEYRFIVYTPLNLAAYDINVGSASDKNGVSPIMIPEYKGRRVMFTGDATQKTEAVFVDYAAVMGVQAEAAVDVLKVAHHGSAYSTTQAFLDLVKPSYAVVSAGAGNAYGHPAPAALARLTAVAGFRALYRTDVHGDIVCVITEKARLLWYNSKEGAVTAALFSDGVKVLYIKQRRECII